MEAEANSSDGGFDDLEMPDPQELSNTGGNSNDEDRQVRSGFGWTGNVKKNFGIALVHLLFARVRIHFLHVCAVRETIKECSFRMH